MSIGPDFLMDWPWDVREGIEDESELPRWLSGKESAFECRRHKRCRLDPWVRKILWSRKWQPSPVLLPVIIYEHRSMAGYSPWVAKSWIYEHSCMHMSLYLQHLLRKLIVSFCSVHWKCVYISRIWKSSLWNVVIKETVLLSPSFSRKVRAKICWHLAPRCQRRQWHPTPVLLPGKSRGRRSLMGCSPWGR